MTAEPIAGSKDLVADEGTYLARGAIDTREIVFLVLAAAAPLTVIAGVAPLSIKFGGIGGPGGYLIAGAVMAVFAVGFTAMSQHVPNAGAFYAYIGAGLGRPAGLGAALIAVFSYSAIEIGLIAACASFAATMLDDVFAWEIPWHACAVVVLAAVAFLGYRSLTLSTRVLGVALLLSMGILGVLAVPVVLNGGASGLSLTMFRPGEVFSTGIGAVFVIAFGAFIGVESTAIYSEEAVDPIRSGRRSTYVAVGVLAVVYTFMGWTIVMAFGPEHAVRIATEDPSGMFAAGMERYVGDRSRDALAILLVASTFAATLAFHSVASRYAFTLAREGAMPRRFGVATQRTGAPGRASNAVSLIATVVLVIFAVAGADPYLHVLLWTNGSGILGVLMLKVLCSVAVIRFFRRRPLAVSRMQGAIAPAAATLALTVVCALVVCNFSLLTGAGSAVNAILIAPLPTVFLVGVGVALRIRRRDPDAYLRLTTTSID
jgi:amino acid transporter